MAMKHAILVQAVLQPEMPVKRLFPLTPTDTHLKSRGNMYRQSKCIVSSSFGILTLQSHVDKQPCQNVDKQPCQKICNVPGNNILFQAELALQASQKACMKGGPLDPKGMSMIDS
eukprot:1159781-Pelagomonas_calceolata.AAC.1